MALGAGGLSLGSAILEMGVNTRAWHNGLDMAAKKWVSFGANIRVAAFRLGTIWAATVGAFTAGVVKIGSSFEKEFTGIRKTVQGTEQQFADLKKALLEVSTTTTFSADQLAILGRKAGQLGIETENIAKFTETIAKLGLAAAELPTEQAAVGLARLLKITGESTENVDILASVLARLGDSFATNEARILNFATRISGLAKVTGMTANETLALGAAFTATVPGVELVATQLSKGMAIFSNAVAEGGEKLDVLNKLVGGDFKAAFEENAAMAIAKFLKGLDDVRASGGNAFAVLKDLGLTNQRAAQAFLAAAGASEQFTKALGIMDEEIQIARTEQGKLNRAFAEQMKTFEAKWIKLWNNVKKVAIDFFDAFSTELKAFLDAAVDLVKFGSDLAAWMNKLPSSVKTAMIAMVGLSGALIAVMAGAGLLIASFGSLLGFLGPTAVATGAAATEATAAAGAFEALFAGSTAAATGIGAIGTALSGIAVAIAGLVGLEIGQLFNQAAADSRGYTDAVDEAIEKHGILKAGLVALPDLFTAGWESGKAAIQAYLDVAGEFWTGFIGAAKDAWDKLDDTVGGGFKAFWEGFSGAAKQAIEPVGTLVSGFQTELEMGYEAIFKAQNNLTTGAAAWTEEQKKAFEEFKKQQDLAERTFEGVTFDTQEATEAARKYAEMIERITPQIEKWRLEEQGWAADIAQRQAAQAEELSSIGMTPGALGGYGMADFETGGPVVPGIGDLYDPAFLTSGGRDFMEGPPVELFEAAKAEVEAMKEEQKEFNRLLEGANIIANMIGGTFGSIVGKITGAAGAMKSLSMLGGGGFGGILGGISQSFSAGSAAVGGGLMGLIGGAANVIPMIGPMIGPAIEGIKALFSIGGPDIARDVGRDLGPQISQELAKAIEESGKPVQLAIGQIFAEGFANNTATADMLANEIGDLFSGFSRGEFGETDLLAALGDSIPMLMEHFGELGAVGEEQVLRIITAAQQMGIEFEGLTELTLQYLEATTTGVNDLINQAAQLGVSLGDISNLIAERMGPTVQEVAEAFGLTNEEARKLAETLGVDLPTKTQVLAKQLGVTPKQLKEIGAALEDEFGIGLDQLQMLLDTMGISIEDLAKSLGVEGVEGTEALANTQEAANSQISAGADMAARLADNLERAARASSGITIPSIPSDGTISAAAGYNSGILTRPTFFPILAHPGEVVNVGPPGSGGGGGQNINISIAPQITVAEPLASADDIERQILPVMVDMIQKDAGSIVGEIERKLERS